MGAPILIVDDEPSNLAILRQILSPDYQLVFARSGEEAIRATLKHRPALVLLDIQMPDMTGYAVCKQLKADPRTAEIPVIFVSGLGDTGDEATGFEVGAVDYIIKPVSPPIVRARVRTHLSLVSASQLEHSYQDAIFMLGAAGHHNDTDTGTHIWRMAAYSGALADACGWPAAASRQLELAAPMHDTGKLGIPNAILRKPGKLDATEWEVMKTHSRIGHEILSKSTAPIFKLAAEIALNHHEKWNGAGYPIGLSGEQIPESARIASIADVFDALTMERPYKKAWPVDRAVEAIMAGAGTDFEPRLVDHFTFILPRILSLKAHWTDLIVPDDKALSSPRFRQGSHHPQAPHHHETQSSPTISDPEQRLSG